MEEQLRTNFPIRNGILGSETIKRITSNDNDRKMGLRFQGEVTEKRHKNMSRIKGKDTSIEVALRKALWAKGYRYRKNYKDLPGKPDIALTSYKIAIFCDSEFFHGKDWDVLRKRLERGANPDYWIEKIGRNIERDRETDLRLQIAGWTVIRFWGKDILKNTDQCISTIEETIFDMKISEEKVSVKSRVMESGTCLVSSHSDSR